ncbi:MAG: TldD/PmbA family protein [Thermoplasmatota archaeon]|nr:TldD/PmbA family protein [Halobacteriales archaeon]
MKARRTQPAMDGEELLGRAERVVAQARSRGIAQAECFLEWSEGLDVELEKGAIASTGAGQGGGGSVRVVVDGRLGFAYFTDVRDAAAALDQAREASRHAEKLDYSLPTASKPRRLGGRWDDRVAAMDVEAAIGMARDLLAGGRETAPKALLSGGGVGLQAEWCAIASSEGVSVWDRATAISAAASLVQEDGRASISASESAASHRLDLDGKAVAAEAGRTLGALLKPAKAEGGRVSVLFRPEAAAELVSDLVISACLGDEARRGKTVWSDKLGKRVAAPRLDYTDDPFVAGAVGGVPFDAEGLPTQPVPIVAKGMLKNFLYDSWDAHRHGAASTRSAIRGDFKARPSTGTHHVVVAGAGARPLDRLLAGVDDGFLVESVLGAHTANATTGDFSVTAPNVWRIRKGAVAGPVREIAIGGNLPDLLLRLDGVSKEAKQMDGMRMPHLLFADVDVSV